MENVEERESVVKDGARGEARAEFRDAAAEAEPDAVRGRRGALSSVADRGTAYLAAGALAVGLLMGWLQFSTDSICCGDFDGYYHARWSQLLWQGTLAGDFTPEFKWLPLTTLNPRDYVDHHYLFHLLQAPFVSLGETGAGRRLASVIEVAPDALGPKISAWLFASLALFACFWLVVRHRLRYPVVWLVALLGCSAPFLFRMNMTKAMSVALALLVVGIHLLFRRKYVWLLPLAFLFTLAYDMFVLLGAAAAVWTAAVLWAERRFEWRPIVFVAVGVVAGTVINPYFPDNVRLLYEHVAMKATRQGFKTAVGNEWYPYESWDFLRNCAVAFAAMLAGYIAFDPKERSRSARPLFFLVFSTVLLVANARWRRFAEYWPPFAVLFAAFSVDAALTHTRAAFDGLRERTRAETWRFAAAVVAAVALCVPVGVYLIAETEEIADSAPHADYKEGAEWMRRNVPAGEVVFNTDWDDFPKLFYYDPTHAYVSGLDPTYLYDRDAGLSKLYDDITLGRERDPGPLIRQRFGARYVFTDNEEVHDQFYVNARDSGWFDRVYADDSCTVLRIRDEKGEPFAEEEHEPEGAGDGDEEPGGAPEQ
ncbi:MAG TPA: hypothetical protein VK421_10340 [Pyrinomonadaceae bacterium]|nr:hypothetical protein [Pyrinomonadaceae bacterium]